MTQLTEHPTDVVLNRLALMEEFENAAVVRAHVDGCAECSAHVQSVRRLQLLFVEPARRVHTMSARA